MDNRTWAERSAAASSAASFEPAPAEVVELTAISRGGSPLGRGATAVLVVAAGVLVVGIAWSPAAGLLGLDEPGPHSPTAVHPSVGDPDLRTPRPASTPRATARPWEWLPAALGVQPFAETVSHLWSVESGVVAAVQLRAGDPRSVLLASVDGRTWEDAGVPVAGAITGSVVDGTLTLLVGSSDEAAPGWQLLSTTDGRAWSGPDPVTGLGDGPGTVTFLVGGPAGWIAIVSGASPDASAAAAVDVRFSDDGRRWAAVDDPLLRAGLDGRWVVDVAADERRWVIVATEPGEAHGTSVAVSLVSEDGLAWSEHSIGTIKGKPRALASGVAGFVLVGGERRWSVEWPVSWLSGAGTAWLPYRHQGNDDRAPAAMDLVTATSHGYLAINRRRGDAWLSTDGEDFVPYPALEPHAFESIDAIACIGDVLLAAGRELGGPMVWTASLDAMLGRRPAR